MQPTNRSWTLFVTSFVTVCASLNPATPVAAPAIDRPPIPIYTPNPTTPEVALGADVMPTARLKLAIDENGRVTSLEVLKIEPSNEHDDAMKQAIGDAVRRWRFGPALKAGQKIAAQLELPVSFMVAVRVPAQLENFTGGPSQSDQSDDALYRQRAYALSLPSATLLRMQKETGDKAEALLNQTKRATASNQWFEVITDSGKGAQQAQALMASLTASYSAVNELIGNRLTSYPAAGKVRAYVFETQRQYEQFVTQVQNGVEWSAGFYHSSGLLAFHAEVPTSNYLYSVLIHEATHAAMDRHLVRRGVSLPRWLDEGFASYLGNSDIVDGKLKYGEHKDKRSVQFYGPFIARFSSASKQESDAAKQAQRQGQALRLQELLSADVGTFYGDRRGLYYAQGWLLVHFLRHGGPSWAEKEFPRFMLYALEGFAVGELLPQIYGADLKTLDEKFQAYMKKF